MTTRKPFPDKYLRSYVYDLRERGENLKVADILEDLLALRSTVRAFLGLLPDTDECFDWDITNELYKMVNTKEINK